VKNDAVAVALAVIVGGFTLIFGCVAYEGSNAVHDLITPTTNGTFVSNIDGGVAGRAYR
jgi:hypothetical protein